MHHAKAETQEMNREARREMSRHTVDISEVQISWSNGIVHLNGRVRAMRGHEHTFHQDLTNLLQSLRHRPSIRDVVTDWTEAG